MAVTAKRRETWQRAAVIETLDTLNSFVTAQELHATMRQNGDVVGLATVYRALQDLADTGQVDTVRTDDGDAIYRRCITTIWSVGSAGRRSRSTAWRSSDGRRRWPAKTTSRTWIMSWRSSVPVQRAPGPADPLMITSRVDWFR